MQFGELVLSVNRGLRTNYQMIDRRGSEVSLIKVGKFIFKRPDNGKMIVEIEGVLLEEDPNKLFPMNHANVEYFKTLIKKHYEKKKNKVGLEVNKLVEERKVILNKITELQTQIDVVKVKNEIDFSGNREKTIRQISKALRKQVSRKERIDFSLKELEVNIEKYEKSKKYSLQIADKDMKRYL